MDREAIDALLNSYAFWLAVSFAAGACVTFLVMFRVDKYFTATLLCLEAMLFIVAATWGKGFVFESFVSIVGDDGVLTEGTATASLGGVTTDEIFLGIIGVAITGALAFLFMLLRYGLDKAGVVGSPTR